MPTMMVDQPLSFLSKLTLSVTARESMIQHDKGKLFLIVLKHHGRGNGPQFSGKLLQFSRREF